MNSRPPDKSNAERTTDRNVGRGRNTGTPASEPRRGFLFSLFSIGTLGASYGLFGLFAARFLYPSGQKATRAKMFVGFQQDVPPLESLNFTAPNGERFLLTNTGAGINPYQAFSSLCPHLGCKVHWDGSAQQFICPCHGGAFRADGVAVAGPPAQDKQNLRQCEIVVEGSSIYAMVDVT